MARLEDGGKLIDGGRISGGECGAAIPDGGRIRSKHGIGDIISGGVRDGPVHGFESGQIFTGR